MKNKILINLAAITFCCMLALTVFAEDKSEEKDEIVLQNGKVLKKPYIISRTPAGLNVGHENGVIFIPFSEMSEKRQKQYNYDPERAKKYKTRITRAQHRRQVRLAKDVKQKKGAANGFFSHGEDDFPQQSTGTQLENELASLLREKARLEKQYSDVNSGRVKPLSGSSDSSYVSYRGGKVYRKNKASYSKKENKNFLDKRRRLKEIKGELQRVSRRITTVRNLIQREKVKGIKVGKTLK